MFPEQKSRLELRIHMVNYKPQALLKFRPGEEQTNCLPRIHTTSPMKICSGEWVQYTGKEAWISWRKMNMFVCGKWLPAGSSSFWGNFKSQSSTTAFCSFMESWQNVNGNKFVMLILHAVFPNVLKVQTYANVSVCIVRVAEWHEFWCVSTKMDEYYVYIYIYKNVSWWISVSSDLCKDTLAHAPGPGVWKLPPGRKTFSMFCQVLFPKQKNIPLARDVFEVLLHTCCIKKSFAKWGHHAWSWKQYMYSIVHVEKIRH